MSLVTGLRASSSRLPAFNVPRHARTVAFRRLASTAPTGTGLSTAQDIDRMKARQAAETAQMFKNAAANGQDLRGPLDLQLHAIPILEPLVDAPFKWNWVWKKFGTNVKTIRKEYKKNIGRAMLDETKTRFNVLWEFVRRGLTTQKMMYELVQADGLETTPSHITKARTWRQWFTSMFPSNADLSVMPSLKRAMDLYVKYHQAQAAGNVKVVRATSILKMREAGERVCRSRSKMRWELEEEPPLPRLKWVRKTPVMEGHHGGRETVQICFSFDTKQRLTTEKGVRSQRVNDNVVIEFIHPEEPAGWLLKERLQAHEPMYLLDKATREELQKKMAAHNQLMMASAGLQ